jgi:hypothetical protein
MPFDAGDKSGENSLGLVHAYQNYYTILHFIPPSLLFLDEDLGSLHFLFTIFYFFLKNAWALSKSKLIAF